MYLGDAQLRAVTSNTDFDQVYKRAVASKITEYLGIIGLRSFKKLSQL